jgi:Protein of unknown function (DUF5672)
MQAPNDRLELPTVTLCAVDTRSPLLALRALQHSRAHIDFARVLLFSDAVGVQQARSCAIEGVEIQALQSARQYSTLLLSGLLPWIDTEHVLICQWDGFVTSPQAWQSEFLSVDYLGAPWGKAPNGYFVGNGGFSLRSRKLLQALSDPGLALHHPEDICICQTNRARLEATHGIGFASLELAQKFAFENETKPGQTFGFHGAYNLPHVLKLTELQAWLDALPSELASSRDGYKLARNLVRVGQLQEAQKLLQRRRSGGQWDWKSWQLALACRVGAMRRGIFSADGHRP